MRPSTDDDSNIPSLTTINIEEGNYRLKNEIVSTNDKYLTVLSIELMKY